MAQLTKTALEAWQIFGGIDREKRTCGNCGKEFSPECDADHFCTVECSANWKPKQMTPVEFWRELGVEIEEKKS